MKNQVTILVMLFVLAILLVATTVVAEQGVYRDRYGNTTGSWSDNGDQRTYRDRDGNTVGTSDRDGDRRDYYGRDGNYTGSRERDRSK